jgi:hypothetical protein
MQNRSAVPYKWENPVSHWVEWCRMLDTKSKFGHFDKVFILISA